MSSTILFGASGFVGKSLTPLFDKQGMAYTAHSSASLDLTAPAAVQAVAEQVRDGDTVILLSALTPEKGNAPEMTLRNILMMKHLLAGIQDKAIAQFIYISSDAVYPLSADMIDEETPMTAGSLYGQMHVMREQFAREAIPADKLTILRPCAIYGEGDTHNAYGICRFLRQAEQGEITLFGGGEEYRDHVHVDDVAGIIFAAHRRKVTGTFNIASGKSWRFRELAAAIQQANKNVTIAQKPRAMPITHRHVNIVKLASAFPDCLPRSIEAGLRQLLSRRAAA